MTASAAHRWYVIALVLLALLLATAAGAAGLFKWEGPWAVTLGLAALAVGAVAGIVEKVIVPKTDQRRQTREQDERARAVELVLTSHGDRTGLAVLNKDRYEVTDVRIECWPPGGASGAHPQPPVSSRGRATTMCPASELPAAANSSTSPAYSRCPTRAPRRASTSGHGC